ncbi:DUF790 family protein [Sandaracinus amylolyticus]|uniref:DUF790 family protein n=1 Tax=Sandaracinus amylolyticus TaxID=927083 RepID=A0A0F6YJL8_9BACT|nr:DUF790 family protein [Sandaracinus amylolyticus]AKF07960.1 hypothetical protein DB32_005109 [Sandaracinus amylolyticus]
MSDVEASPRWLDARDHRWLAALIATYQRAEGRPIRELDEMLVSPLAPPRRVKLARSVLDDLWSDRVGGAHDPEHVRSIVFRAATSEASREAAMLAASRALALPVAAIEEALFADLPSERLVAAPRTVPSPADLAIRCNHALARALLARASSVRLDVEGDPHDVVRACKRRGLVCVVHPEEHGARLEISGPLSLFRATRVYGRALASLLPALAGVRRFRLRALVAGDSGPRSWIVRERDPVFVEGMRAPALDGEVGDAFAKRFARLTHDWDLVRDPEPVRAGDVLVVPDFALVHRHDARRRWLVEIVGYWTPAYLRAKVDRLRDAGIEQLVLCVSDRLACAGDEVPEGAPIVRFAQRVDPRAVLAAMGDPVVKRRKKR